jgi:long-chain acyl-CoA synthetase
MKIPEGIFDALKSSLRKASRFISGKSFLKEAVEDIQFVVHGLAPAVEANVRILEKLGIPVIESYGTTHAAGMLSSNLFLTPHFKVIGTPLPHVNFRLGAHSTLEYRLSSSFFENSGKWEETGDVAQMTPFGFIITGRKRHLFVTLGGTVVSPVRLEQLLKENDIITDACVIGDKMPYLSALIVLNHDALADFRVSPDKIRQQVQEVVDKVNETLPRNVTLKKFSILDKPFTESSGEKLTNGEINRLKIQETRSSLISSLYQ